LFTKGFALAVRLGATKEDFDDLVSIHPTDAEAFCSLSVTKSSGHSWVAAGGCGGEENNFLLFASK
jgi:thioredoxin reductase (NADPH)